MSLQNITENGFKDVRTENGSSQGQNLALTVLCVPHLLDMRAHNLSVAQAGSSADRDDEPRSDLVSQKVLITVFCKSQFPHKSVNLFFISVIITG